MAIVSYDSIKPGPCARCGALNSSHSIHVYGLYRRFCNACVESHIELNHLLGTHKMQSSWLHFPAHPINELVTPKVGDIFQWNGEHSEQLAHVYEYHVEQCGSKRVVTRHKRRTKGTIDSVAEKARYWHRKEFERLTMKGDYKFTSNIHNVNPNII